MALTYIRSLRNVNIPKELIQMRGCRTFAVVSKGAKGGATANAPKASTICIYLFPRSNSSFVLCSGNALQSEVLRLREEMFLQILERFFVDLVAGESVIKQRAAARFNDLVRSTEVVAGEPLLLPQKFRQNRAWMELNKIWRTNSKVKGFIVDKVRGGNSVAIAGFIPFLPFRPRWKRKPCDRFTIESINSKKANIVVF
ncbi:unnamed protein product [Withania somnifera]